MSLEHSPARHSLGRAKTISEFCENNRVSLSFYFKLQRQGLAPKTMSVGKRRLISPEAEDAWRRAREQPEAV